MTPHAIRQFVTLVGSDAIAKGARWVEPLLGYPQSAFVIGQHTYVSYRLHCAHTVNLCNPFEPDTPHAALWAAGKLLERKHERAVVEAYEQAKWRQS